MRGERAARRKAQRPRRAVADRIEKAARSVVRGVGRGRLAVQQLARTAAAAEAAAKKAAGGLGAAQARAAATRVANATQAAAAWAARLPSGSRRSSRRNSSSDAAAAAEEQLGKTPSNRINAMDEVVTLVQRSLQLFVQKCGSEEKAQAACLASAQSGLCPRPQYRRTTSGRLELRCSSCHHRLAVSWHTVAHICRKEPQVSNELCSRLAQQLGMGAGPQSPAGRCPLCSRMWRAGSGGQHPCRWVPWRLLITDQSALEECSPALQGGVVLQQGPLARLRELGPVVVQVVFPVPEPYLPASGQLKGGEPLLCRSEQLLAPSSYVPGQRGVFWVHTPDHCAAGGGFAAGALEGFAASFAGGQWSTPAETRTLMALYTGVLERGLLSQLPEEPGAGQLMRVSVTARVHYQPAHVGGLACMINCAHGPARVLDTEVHSLPAAAAPGGNLQLQLLRARAAASTAPGRPGWFVDARGKVFLGGQAGREMAWDYGAASSEPRDPLSRVRCRCAACTRSLPGMQPDDWSEEQRMLVVLKRS